MRGLKWRIKRKKVVLTGPCDWNDKKFVRSVCDGGTPET